MVIFAEYQYIMLYFLYDFYNMNDVDLWRNAFLYMAEKWCADIIIEETTDEKEK